MIYNLYKEQIVKSDIAKVWEFFSTPKNLNDLTPPELEFRIKTVLPEKMYNGQLISYKVKVAPFIWLSWLTEIKYVKEMHSFVDEQRIGPYKFWFHKHSFIPVDGGIKIIDDITYDVGFGFIGMLAHFLFVKKKLEYIFSFRQNIISQVFK